MFRVCPFRSSAWVVQVAAFTVLALLACSDDSPSRPEPSAPDPSMDYREFVGWRSTIDVPEQVRMLGGAAPVAFVVSGDWYSSTRGVHLLDMTDRLRPRFAGSFEITGAVVALESRGGEEVSSSTPQRTR